MGSAVDQGLSSSRDPPGPGFRHQMRRGGDHARMRIVRVFQRQVTKPVGGRSRQVDLDRHGLPLDNASQAAERIEHLFHGGQELSGVIGFASGDCHRGCGRSGPARQG